MTTSFWSKWNIARGTWRRTLVSRTKVFRISLGLRVPQMARSLQLENNNEHLEVHDLRVRRRQRGSACSLPGVQRGRIDVRRVERGATRDRAQSIPATRRARPDRARLQPRP